MRKGWKIFWIVCASVFGIGVVLCIAGFAVGISDREVREAFRNGFGRFGIHTNHVVTDYETHTEMTVEEVGGEESIPFMGVRNLDVEVKALEFRVVESDEVDVRLVKDVSRECEEHLQIYKEGNTLHIEMEDWKHHDPNAGSITLYVPEGMVLDSVEFSSGAASLELEGLHAREVDLEVGAGSIEASLVEADEISLTCGMGSIAMTAGGRQEDYNYDLEVGMGSVRLGGSEFGGMAMEKNINNRAAKKMDIECGMGSIEIGYEQ